MHRPSFVRQAANLWAVKQRLPQHLLGQVSLDPHVWLVGKRRRIETVIGQLTGRYQLRWVWARDGWHLWSRWLRKLLSHTMAALLCQQAGLPPLRFAQLITA